MLQVAKRNAEKAGVQDRYELLPGSAFDVPYGGAYDAVLLTNFLHHFDHPANVSLLKKVHTALKPGGVAATLEFVPNDDRVSPPQSASFALTMLGINTFGRRIHAERTDGDVRRSRIPQRHRAPDSDESTDCGPWPRLR